MKTRRILLFVLGLFFQLVHGQSDSMFFHNKAVYPVQLIEVSESEIKYKRTDLTDGPVYTTNSEKVRKIKYKNGTEYYLQKDVLELEVLQKNLANQRTAYKFYIFDLPTGKLSFGYESVLKTGINLDVKAGVFTSNLYDGFHDNYGSRRSIFNPFGARYASGTFLRGGAKFLTPDIGYRLNGKRLEHFLHGSYIRFDAYLSFMRFDDIRYLVPVITRTPGSTFGFWSYEEKSTNASNFNAGFLICLGKQYVMANFLTIDYYVGLGFNYASYSFTNPDFTKRGPRQLNSQNYYDYYQSDIQNVLAAQKIAGFLSGTLGFNIGFVHQSKNKPNKRSALQ
jgi:hypothetical protein